MKSEEEKGKISYQQDLSLLLTVVQLGAALGPRHGSTGWRAD